MLSNRGVLLNENVCFDFDRLVSDPFISLNEATEVRQNFDFIKFIIYCNNQIKIVLVTQNNRNPFQLCLNAFILLVSTFITLI